MTTNDWLILGATVLGIAALVGIFVTKTAGSRATRRERRAPEPGR